MSSKQSGCSRRIRSFMPRGPAGHRIHREKLFSTWIPGQLEQPNAHATHVLAQPGTLEQSILKKILTVLGARPQFIKASVVSDAIRTSQRLTEVLVHSGQLVTSNSDTGNNNDAFVVVRAQPGDTFYIRVRSDTVLNRVTPSQNAFNREKATGPFYLVIDAIATPITRFRGWSTPTCRMCSSRNWAWSNPPIRWVSMAVGMAR